MKNYRKQAAHYVAGLKSGTILPSSDQFTEVLRFLKSFRKHGGSNPATGPLYRKLAGLSRKRLYAEIALPLSGNFRLISKGKAHLLAGLLEKDDRTWFAKTVSTAPADELDVVRALMNGRIPQSGQHFAFLVPASVILTPGLVTYVSPAIEPTPLEQDMRVQPNDVPTIVRGIAETNVALGCFPRSACPLPFRQQDAGLNEIDRARLQATFGELDDHALDALCDRFEMIRAGWPSLQRAFDTAIWGLAHGDLASLNATVLDGRLVYLDLGATGFGPLGSDLYWLLYKNHAHPEDQRQIVAAYCAELGHLGVAVSEDEIYATALTRYAQKWLFPSRRGTQASLEHIRQTQDAVLDLLRNMPALQTRHGEYVSG